jgi:hypothetical protein
MVFGLVWTSSQREERERGDATLSGMSAPKSSTWEWYLPSRESPDVSKIYKFVGNLPTPESEIFQLIR